MSAPPGSTRPGAAPALTLAGRLDAAAVSRLWSPSLAALAAHPDRPFPVDCSGVEYIDGAGLALLTELRLRPRAAGAAVTIEGLPERFRPLLDQADPGQFAAPPAAAPRRPGWIETLGRGAAGGFAEFRAFVTFLGHATATTLAALARPRSVRWGDTLAIAQEAGAGALPIVALVSFLVGVILAFQAGIAMRQFGATLYVADLLGISITRELGPLMMAIMFTGRSGAAFAAELGTMKVNEEVDAIDTMGLDPVRFLVVPRLLAGISVAPVLAVFSDVIGIVGGAAVMPAFGIPVIAYANEVLAATTITDFVGGIVKSFVFGVVVAGVGCLRGLQTRSGAAAVGLSTTSAVVTGIVLIVVVDGIFAMAYYYLGV
jgi:phospholipid/cholesterol/gamma-HCH transport system permease protein